MNSPLQIRLHPEYDSYPLFTTDSSGHLDNVPGAAVGAPTELSEALEEWSNTFGRTLNGDDPASSGFKTELEKDLFVHWGRSLAHQLANCLSQDIEYVNNSSGERELIEPTAS